MHIYKSRFLVRGEVWYDHKPEPVPVDWVYYHQRSCPVAGAKWKYFHSIVLDLSQDAKALLQGMNKTTAYHVRRARDKDRIVCECQNPVSREMLDRFEETYNSFAAIKGLSPLDRPFLDRLAEDGFLELSLAKDSEGRPLIYHAYYRDSNRSCLLHTISLHQQLSDSAGRNAVARANRYLFWCDILRHQEQGLKIFDFGGWYPGDTDQELLDINRFKEGFGAKVVREYDCEQILSFKGRVVLTVAAMLNWARGVAAKFRPAPARRELEIAADEAKPSSTGFSPVAEPAALSD